MPARPFSLGRVEIGGEPVSIAVIGDGQTAIRLEASIDELLADWEAAWPGLVALVDAEADGSLPAAALVGVHDHRLLTPFTPGKVLQSGMNYKKHVVDLIVARARKAEPGRDLDEVRAAAAARMEERATEGEPFVFIGLAEAMCGAGDQVVLPSFGTEHDWELELGVVIGRGGRHIRREDALGHVAGYVAGNDVTTRDLVFRGGADAVGADWFRAKNAPTFLPTGPWLVPAAFVADPGDVTIRLSHNGDVMQDESTADMIFDVARLIEFCSVTLPLAPGDLIMTGSPAGNGAHWGRALRPGDELEATIIVAGLEGPGFGVQRTTCVAERVD
jgi:2-keto-4-pentenoate hydratase/2-oxohepta-3-ene-1,7-dioic acid hydratase in catechol pathway